MSLSDRFQDWYDSMKAAVAGEDRERAATRRVYLTPENVDDAPGGATVKSDGGRLYYETVAAMKAVPEEAVHIDSREEAPEDAEIVEGERGGLYYLPPDADAGGGEEKPAGEPVSDFDDIEEGDTVSLEFGEHYPDDADVSGEVTNADPYDFHVDGEKVSFGSLTNAEFYWRDGNEPGGEPTGEPTGEPGGEADTGGDVGETASAMLEDFSFEGVTDAVEESYGEETAQEFHDQIEGWHSMGLKDSGTAADLDGAITNDEPENELQEAWQDFSEASKAYVREEYGEEVQLHRGVHSGHAADIKEAAEAGEPLEISGPPTASWSVDEDVAEEYADEVASEDGVVMTRTVSADDVAYAPVALGGYFEDMGELMFEQTDAWELDPDEVEVIV